VHMLNNDNLKYRVSLVNKDTWNEKDKKYEKALIQFDERKVFKDLSRYFVKSRMYELTPDNLRFAEAIFASWLEDRFGKEARFMYEEKSALPVELYPESEQLVSNLKNKTIKSHIDIAFDILTKQNQNINCHYNILDGDSVKGGVTIDLSGLKIICWSGYLAKGPFSCDRSVYTSMLMIGSKLGTVGDSDKITSFINKYSR
jgi:hypothetical protein